MIKHVLNDGSIVNTLEGTLIKKEDFEVLYEVIRKIEEEGSETCEPVQTPD